MEPSDLQRHVVGVLERLGVQYFVTGSMATIFYGEPRLTNDIDIVADLKPEHVAGLVTAFPPDEYYISADAVRLAIAKHFQFNIIHPTSGLKVDVVVPEPTDFNRARMTRAVRINPAPDYEAYYTSPEDIVVKKMDAYREGGSDKHLRDIASVMKVLGERLDREYIRDWSDRLGLTDIWQAIVKRVDG